jgi:hypothetical protein
LWWKSPRDRFYKLIFFIPLYVFNSFTGHKL